jgi:hypothetical protein
MDGILRQLGLQSPCARSHAVRAVRSSIAKRDRDGQPRTETCSSGPFSAGRFDDVLADFQGALHGTRRAEPAAESELLMIARRDAPTLFPSARAHIFLMTVFLASLGSRSVLASDEPQVDRPTTTELPPTHEIDRTSLYGDDARVPVPMTVVATSSFSYTNVGTDPTQVSSPYPAAGVGCYTAGGESRPCYASFASNTAQPGAQMIIAGELGLLPRLSVLGTFMTGFGGSGGVPNPDVGGAVGLRLRLLPESWTRTHLVVSGGYIREAYNPPVYDDDKTPAVWLPGSAGGTNAGYAQLAFSGDVGRFRLGGTFHAQHTFADGRDPLDVMVDLGASIRVVSEFRLGAEYVGQDLEESFDPGAEGGARHFLGPTASMQFWNRRITVVGGPAIGLSAISPDFVARIGASVGF